MWHGTLNGKYWSGFRCLVYGILQIVLAKEGTITYQDFCKKFPLGEIPYKGKHFLIEQKDFPSSDKRYDQNHPIQIDGKTYYITTQWGGDNIWTLEKKAILEYGCYIERYNDDGINYAGVYSTEEGHIPRRKPRPKQPSHIPGYRGIQGMYVSYSPWVKSCYQVDGLASYLDDVYMKVARFLESIFPEAKDTPLPHVYLDDGLMSVDYSDIKDGYIQAALTDIAEDYETTQCPLAVLSGILRNSNTQWQITTAMLSNLLTDPLISLDTAAKQCIKKALSILQDDCNSAEYVSGLYTGDIRIYYRCQGNYLTLEEYMASIANTLAHEFFHAFHHDLAPKEFGKGFIDPTKMRYTESPFPAINNHDSSEERRDRDSDVAQNNMYPRDIYKSIGRAKEKWEATVVQEASADYFAFLYSLNDVLTNPGNIETADNSFSTWYSEYGYSPYSYALHYMPKFGVQCNDYNSHLSSPNSINKLKKVIYKSVDSMEDAYDLLIR